MMFRYLSKAKAMLALLAAIALGMLVSCNQTEEAPETVMGFTCLEDLEGHTVAVIKGSTSDVLLGDTNNFSNITLIQCNTPTDLFKAIESGNAECAITDTVVLMTMKLKEHKMAVDFNLAPEEAAYLEELYVPHPLAGVMAQNQPANRNEKHVWSTGSQKI